MTGCWYALGSAGREQVDAYLGRYLAFLGPAAASLGATVPTTTTVGLRDAAARARDMGADELVLVPTTSDPDDVKRVADVLG